MAHHNIMIYNDIKDCPTAGHRAMRASAPPAGNGPHPPPASRLRGQGLRPTPLAAVRHFVSRVTNTDQDTL